MFKHIEKIQQKSEQERKNITLFVTIGLFSVVVFLWLFLSNLNIISKEYTEDNVKTPSPFASIKDTFGGIVDDVKEKTESSENYFNIQ